MRREIPSETVGDGHDHHRAFSPFEALMSAAPGEPIDVSSMELLALRDLLADAMTASLTDLELWVFNLVVVERRSLRYLEPSVPKTTVARIRDRAIRKLRVSLEEHPLIIEYLEGQ